MQRQWAYVRFQPKVQGLNPIYDYAENLVQQCQKRALVHLGII